MLRIALAGTYKSIYYYAELVRKVSGCLLTGVYTELKNQDDFPLNNYPEVIIDNINNLPNVADVIVFCDQSYINYDLVKSILKRSKHVFIFPDYSLSYYQTEKLQKIADEAGVCLYLRHKVIPDNIQNLINKYINDPEYIDIYRNMDRHKENNINKIYETFYNELLFILSINKHEYRRSYIHTVPYFSSLPAMINIRIVFSNGTSANLTINNFSDKDTRHIELFRSNQMLYLDSLKSFGKFICKETNESRVLQIGKQTLQNKDISVELFSFLNSLLTTNFFSSHFESGIALHKTATQIIDRIIPYPVEN